MFTPKKFIISLPLLLLLSLTLFALDRAPEPSYNGHPLSYWVEMFSHIWSIQRYEEGSKGIKAIGTNAIPYLVDWLDEDRIPATAHKDTCSAGALFAIGLRVLGEDTKLAIPHLARLLVETRNPRCSRDVARMLASLLPEGGPALVAASTNQHAHVRFAVAHALDKSYLGTNLNSLLPLLEKLAHDPDKEVAEAAQGNIPFKPSPGK